MVAHGRIPRDPTPSGKWGSCSPEGPSDGFRNSSEPSRAVGYMSNPTKKADKRSGGPGGAVNPSAGRRADGGRAVAVLVNCGPRPCVRLRSGYPPAGWLRTAGTGTRGRRRKRSEHSPYTEQATDVVRPRRLTWPRESPSIISRAPRGPPSGCRSARTATTTSSRDQPASRPLYPASAARAVGRSCPARPSGLTPSAPRR